MYSYTEENYLKAIYKLSEVGSGLANTNSIAETLDTKASSVTDMLKRLASKNLLDYEKYQGVQLTQLGKKQALNIIRKHRLWEVFLVEKLNFGWDEVHEVAEQLEHIRSEKLIRELDKLLGYPQSDPHGDPIPDENGTIKQLKSKALAVCEKDKEYVMVGVSNHSNEFLLYLNASDIGLGVQIKINEINAFDQSMKVHLNKAKELFISREVAANILVIPNR